MSVDVSVEDARTIATRARSDPLWFISNILGCQTWSKQREIIESVRDHPRTAVRSCSSSGKSWTASVIALWFLFTHYPSTVITTAPTFRQVESILWREIAARYAQSKEPLGGKLTNVKLDIAEDWFALGLSTDEPERFQGFHNENVLVIVDEASGVSEDVFQAIENPLSAGNAKLLLIGNPTQQVGTFRDAFTSSIYNPIHISAFDTPNFTHESSAFPFLITPSWVEERREEWGDGSYLYQVYVEGNFPNIGVDNLFSLEEVESAVNRSVSDSEVLEAAIDVSRYGDDETVLMLRRGNKVVRTEFWGHQDTVYTAGRTARFCREWGPQVLYVDSVGVGAGVADMLREEKINAVDVNVGEKALDSEQFANKRAELYWLLHKRLEGEEISIQDDSKLKSQLCDIRYKYNGKGQLVIESKEDARSRGSKSPDRADTLMLLFSKAENKNSATPFAKVIYTWSN